MTGSDNFMHLLKYMYRQPTNALSDMQASGWICGGHWLGAVSVVVVVVAVESLI